MVCAVRLVHLCVCVYARVHACVCSCLRVCVRACVCAGACPCLRARGRDCMSADHRQHVKRIGRQRGHFQGSRIDRAAFLRAHTCRIDAQSAGRII